MDYLIKVGIRTSNYYEISKWNEVIEGGIDADILVVGSSRAMVHFDPAQIEERTGLSCYNLGLDGSKYEAQKKVLELYLKHNRKPKKIIWSLDFTSFQEVEGIYRYEQFIPFWEEPKVKEILALNQNMDLNYLEYPIVRYSNNSSMKYRGLLSFAPINHSEPNLYKGFRIQNKKWDGKFEEFMKVNTGGRNVLFDTLIFEDFIKFNSGLIQEKVVVTWCVAPYYEEAIAAISNYQQILSTIKRNANLLEVPFLDISNSYISNSKDNFYNGSHLNQKGVTLFMELIEL